MVSIIIPVLNEAKIIEHLLLHLAKNVSLKTNIEIIIVDGGSKDTTLDVIQNFIKGIPYVNRALFK